MKITSLNSLAVSLSASAKEMSAPKSTQRLRKTIPDNFWIVVQCNNQPQKKMSRCGSILQYSNTIQLESKLGKPKELTTQSTFKIKNGRPN